MNANKDRLWTLSRAWASYGKIEQVSGQEQLSFIHALLNNGQVSRSVVSRSPFSTDIGKEFLIQNNSTRKTSAARDLVLSTMSQYTASSAQQVREMSSAALYAHCFSQARAANRAVLPRITGGMVGENAGALETSNVPEPANLGDLVKLFSMAL